MKTTLNQISKDRVKRDAESIIRECNRPDSFATYISEKAHSIIHELQD